MPSVKLKENDSSDALVRRFKRAVEKSGILAELKKRQFYVKPSKLRQRAKAAALKRWRKKVIREIRDREDRDRF